MGPLRHGSARTTAALRRAIQQSQQRIAKLSGRYHRNPKTVAKWKKRTPVPDALLGPKPPRATILTLEQEVLMGACRKPTLLLRDDCLSAVHATRPSLTRSALHRCLQRHGSNRLPERTGDKPQKKKFKAYAIGDFHIAIAEVGTEEGKLQVVVAIDRASKLADAEWQTDAPNTVAAQFLRNLMAAVPDKLHTVRTDHGIQFTNRKGDQYAFQQIFERVCQEAGLEHRLPTTHPPWTNGQVERMHRPLQEATGKQSSDQTHHPLKEQIHAFLMADNFATRLKTLKGLTPDEPICQSWQTEPDRCTINPDHHTLGLNT